MEIKLNAKEIKSIVAKHLYIKFQVDSRVEDIEISASYGSLDYVLWREPEEEDWKPELVTQAAPLELEG